MLVENTRIARLPFVPAMGPSPFLGRGSSNRHLKIQQLSQPVERFHGDSTLAEHELRHCRLVDACLLPDAITADAARRDHRAKLIAQRHSFCTTLCHRRILPDTGRLVQVLLIPRISRDRVVGRSGNTRHEIVGSHFNAIIVSVVSNDAEERLRRHSSTLLHAVSPSVRRSRRGSPPTGRAAGPLQPTRHAARQPATVRLGRVERAGVGVRSSSATTRGEPRSPERWRLHRSPTPTAGVLQDD